MVDDPGIAFLIVGDAPGASAKVIFDSILQGWPILVITVVLAALAGIIMWMLVSIPKKECLVITKMESLQFIYKVTLSQDSYLKILIIC